MNPQRELEAAMRKARQAVTDFTQGAASGNAELMVASFAALDYGKYDGGGWARAMRAASRLKRVPRATREGFLRVYIAHGDHIRQECNDLDLADGLRALLPAYRGAAVRLYRGESARNRARRTYGLSWTVRKDVALDFAEMGMYRASDGGSVLLETLAPREAIICAVPASHDRYDEGEYIVDRRRLKHVNIVARFPQFTRDQESITGDKKWHARIYGP